MEHSAQQTAPAADPIRVLIVDDHRAILLGLKGLIESQRPRMELFGTATTREETFAAISESCPHIILLDLELGEVNSLDFLPELLNRCGERTRVIVLTGSRDTERHDRAIRLGARGVLLKNEPLEDILKAIEKVQRGELWLDRATSARMFAEYSGQGAARRREQEALKAAELTPRQREIVALVGEGLNNEQIAGRLFISEKTVRNNLTEVFDKLGVSDRLQLAIYAYRHGLAKLPGSESTSEHRP